jgi:inner membrane protein
MLGFSPALIVLGVFAALLPDIDITSSPFGRIFSPVSKHLSKHYAHRSITHSLLALILISISGIFFGVQTAVSLLIGYLSHLILDMLNPSGVPLIYPKTSHFVLLGGSVKVGDRGETILFSILLITIIALVCFNVLNVSPSYFLNSLFAVSTKAQVGQWEQLKQKNVVEAEVSGYWSYSKTYVEMIGNVTDGRGSVLYIENNNSIYSVSNEEGSSIIAIKIDLRPLNEVETIEFIYESKDYSNYSDFLEILSNSSLVSGQIYFYNQISSEQKFDIEQIQMERPEGFAPIKVLDRNIIEFRQSPAGFFKRISCCVPDGGIKTGPIYVTVIT